MKHIDQNIVLDEIDKKIIQFLSENARRPITEIGRNLLISGAAVHQRIRKLEEARVIIGSRIEPLRAHLLSRAPSRLPRDPRGLCGHPETRVSLPKDAVPQEYNLPLDANIPLDKGLD